MLFRNGRILTMEAETGEIASGFVLVKDGKIAAVGTMEGCPTAEGDEIVELGGRLLLPGFIDAHCHTGLYEDSLGAEGDDVNEEGEPAPHLRAIDGINPMDRGFTDARRSGVTCAVVSPGSANPIAGQIAAIKTAGLWVDQMAVAEPLAIKFALGENPKMIYGTKNQTPYTRMAIAAIIREQLAKARRYLLACHAAESDPSAAEPEYDARCEALIPLLRGNIAAHFHAHKAYDILTAVRIAEEFDLDYTIIHCTEGHLIADILVEKGAKAVVGPLINTRMKPELAGMDAGSCAALVKAGVTVGICTDHPEVPSDFLAASAALAVRGGLGREEALAAVTIGAARAVGLDSRLGSVAPGKDADLLVCGEDPLGLRTEPDAVYIEGRIVAGKP